MAVKEKAEAYLELSRPKTLVTPLLGGVMFSLMGYRAVYDWPTFDGWLKILLVGVLLAFMNYASNALNQIVDRDIDALLPRKKNRPIPSGRISPEEATGVVVVLLVFVLSVGYSAFGFYFGTLLAVIGVFVWLYNTPPLRLKKRFFWSNLSISVPRGALGITAAYSAFASPFDVEILVPALAFGVYVFGVNTLKDIDDYEADLKMGVKNFCTVYGKRKACILVIPFLYLPFLIFALTDNLHMLPLVGLSLLITLFIYRNAPLEGRGQILWTLFYLQLTLMILAYTLTYTVGGTPLKVT